MSLREQKKQQARAQIIEAAGTLFAAKGVDEATTREIARQAGVSYQTLYNYFPSKALLVRELLNEEVANWSQGAEQIVKRYDGDPVGSLMAITELGLTMLMGSKHDLWVSLSRQVFQNFDPDQLTGLTTVAHEHCYGLLSMAQGMGHLRRDADLHLMAHTLFCLADYNLLMQHLTPVAKEKFLATQREQFELIITPYLVSTG